jgi:hypothetical protein
MQFSLENNFTLPFPSLPFPSLPFPSLPFPSLPFPSLPFPFLPFPSFYLLKPFNCQKNGINLLKPPNTLPCFITCNISFLKQTICQYLKPTCHDLSSSSYIAKITGTGYCFNYWSRICCTMCAVTLKCMKWQCFHIFKYTKSQDC